MKIHVVGFLHEMITFVASRADYDAFDRSASCPICRGSHDEMLRSHIRPQPSRTTPL